MKKILCVAWREFCATALTKGFIFGVVMTPLLILVVGGAVALMKSIGAPKIVGTVAVIDRSGQVGELVKQRFSKEGLAAEAAEDGRRVTEAVKEQADRIGLHGEAAEGASGAINAQVAQQAATGPELTLEVLPSDADLDKEKALVAEAKIRTARDANAHADAGRLALIVIPADTVKGDATQPYPAFEAYFAEKLDFEVQQRIERRVGDAVVDARLASDPRLSSSGMAPPDVRRLMRRPSAQAMEVGKEGDKKSVGELKFLLPMGLMILMMISVFTSGQYLLTSTVEEKGNRVMEVLLSAVSPMQLMAGKIVGQMAVGLVILLLYSGLGIVSVVAFLHQTNLIDGRHILYLFVYFGIAYFLVAGMMAAIGAAVNEMREAQSLMSPVMVVLMIPWLTWFVIQRAPNSLMATVLSFIPGPSPFVMVIRLSGSEPIPAWQIPATMLVGVVSVVLMLWAAGKVFRIGALMFGKPPNLRTLIRWVRMA
jgi:ABC-type Na+ efflux pump permease subunit